ncbi:MAG: NUDIX domain-containing protein [Calditrichia bacterium]
MPYTYPYPRPMVTVDILLVRLRQGKPEILLIQRKHSPFEGKWALPGGFVEMEEDLTDAASRELAEETGLQGLPLTEIGVFGRPGRDPRGRTITIVFLGIIPFNYSMNVRPGDDAARVQWFPVSALPELAFDHLQIVETSLEKFRQNCILNFWFLLFFNGQYFSAGDARDVLLRSTNFNLSEAEVQYLLNEIDFLERDKNTTNFKLTISSNKLFETTSVKATDIWYRVLKDSSPGLK